jgi:tRNA pseudouridine55 synthase
VARRPGQVEIEGRLIDVLDCDVVLDCSSGTYVRALARDLGAALGTAGHLTALRRLRVGPFEVSDALMLSENPQELPHVDDLTGRLLALGAVAAKVLPVRVLSESDVRAVGFGQALSPGEGGDRPVAGVNAQGDLVAVLTDRGGMARPLTVFGPATAASR